MSSAVTAWHFLVIWMPFISLSWLVRTSELHCSLSCSRSWRESLRFSPFSIMLMVGFTIHPLLCWGLFLPYLICGWFLTWRDIEFLFCTYWDDRMFWAFLLLMWFIDLSMLNLLCISWKNPTWSWGMIILISCWIHFTSSFGRYWHKYSFDYSPVILLFGFVLVCFFIGVILVL